MEITPIKIITALRRSDEYIHYIFEEGGCYQFHIFLKELFTNAIPYINTDRNHIITRIGLRYYDITGTFYINNSWSLLTDKDIDMVKKWSFAKTKLLKLTECPACEEPICV